MVWSMDSMNSKHIHYVKMTLEDFEKSLTKDKNEQGKTKSSHGLEGSRKRHRHHRKLYDDGEDNRRHKRRKRSTSKDDNNRSQSGRGASIEFRIEHTENGTSRGEGERDPSTWSPGKNDSHLPASNFSGEMKRDSWMELPSSLDIDYTQKGVRKPSEPITSRTAKVDFELKIKENELNKH